MLNTYNFTNLLFSIEILEPRKFYVFILFIFILIFLKQETLYGLQCKDFRPILCITLGCLLAI